MFKNNARPHAVLSCALAFSLAAPVAACAETTGQYIDDTAITTKVKAAFLDDTKLKGSDISVETNQASVVLTGRVQTQAQEAEAVHVAGQVTGVKTVMDQVTVRSSQEQ